MIDPTTTIEYSALAVAKTTQTIYETGGYDFNFLHFAAGILAYFVAGSVICLVLLAGDKEEECTDLPTFAFVVTLWPLAVFLYTLDHIKKGILNA